MSVLSGMVFTSENREADIDSMKNCLKVLKKNTGVFSTLRSTERLFLVSKMVLADDPEKYLENVKALYDKIKKGHIFKDSYMVVAAVNIADAGKVFEADQIIAKFKDIMKLMKKEHPFLTGDEDMPMAISLAMTDKTPEDIVMEMEESYQILKKELKASSNSIQGLAEVLTLQDGSAQGKCREVLSIYKAFRSNHRKYSKEYGLASLGALIGSSKDHDTLVNEICETERYIAHQKGMGMSVMCRTDRLMLAALIVADGEGIATDSMKNPIIVETLQTILAMEIAIACAVAASSSSSSH
jgi:hypothetical protein